MQECCYILNIAALLNMLHDIPENELLKPSYSFMPSLGLIYHVLGMKNIHITYRKFILIYMW